MEKYERLMEKEEDKQQRKINEVQRQRKIEKIKLEREIQQSIEEFNQD